ncbi:MAG: Molybdenum cofactor guanylyltransferase [Gammaproteobacteria bacterium]|nr:Molybdenum cofactor guanylyltransferase [Gammaproteobacteria bacterium]
MSTSTSKAPKDAAHTTAAGSIAAPIYALVLAGGRSTRMQRDKAALAYHGRTQLEWAVSLLQPHAQRVFISVRPDQTGDPVRARFDQIVDTHENLGPAAGIMAAQAKHPQVAWLVLACDLPFLDNATLTHLIGARQPQRLATAYRSSHDGLPEPLCAIYEPASREPLLAHVAKGKDCPRKFLINSDVQLIDEPNPNALDNVNTPDEYGAAMAALSPAEIPGAKKIDAGTGRVHVGTKPGAGAAGARGATTTTPGSAAGATLNGAPADKRIKVQYYAILREQAGRSDESIVTAAHTPRDLYNELKSRYPFSLAPEMLRVAVNAEFGEWSQRLADGDSVVFIPPVAGG